MSPCEVAGVGLCDFRPQIRKGTCQRTTQNLISWKKTTIKRIHLTNVADATAIIKGKNANISVLFIIIILNQIVIQKKGQISNLAF